MELLPEGAKVHERYTVERVLGRGGMSVVYLVSDLRLPGSLWALKEMGAHLPADLAAVVMTQFRTEAAILSHLSHSRLPSVIDFFDSGGKSYLILEYLQGQTLAALQAESPTPFSQERVQKWAFELCDVLQYLHSQNPPVIFRDIKPDNIIVDSEDHLKLIDFGIARLFAPGKAQDTIVIGTPGFAAPEQYGRGQTDERSDIYSLGATLYCLATGRNPQERPFSFSIPSSINPAVTPRIDTVIMTCLDLDPMRRYQSIEAVRKALLGESTQMLSPEMTPSMAGIELHISHHELSLEASPSRLPVSASFTVKNTGRHPLSATVLTNKTWLKASPEFIGENEKTVTVTASLREEHRERRYHGKVVIATKLQSVPIAVTVTVKPTLLERNVPTLLTAVFLLAEALVPLVGSLLLPFTYLMLTRDERRSHRKTFIAAFMLSLVTDVLFLLLL
jgi:serine/threonine protein kinase